MRVRPHSQRSYPRDLHTAGVMPILRRLVSPRIIMLGSFAGTSMMNYAFGLLAGWLLLPGDFGLLAFGQTVLLIAGLVLNSGFTGSLTATLLRHTGPRRAAIIRGALGANVALATLMSVAIIGLFLLGPLRRGFETLPIVLVVAAALPLLGGVAIVRAAAQGVGRFGILAALQVIEIASKLIIGVLLMHFGLGAFGALLGFFVGGVIACGVGLWVLTAVLGVAPIGSLQKPTFGVAQAMFVTLVGQALLLNLDLLTLKLFSTVDRAVIGHYQAAIVLTNAPYYLMMALTPVLFNQVAKLETLKHTGVVVGTIARWALLVLLPLEFALACFPQTALTSLFPASYADGALPMRLLALGNAAMILVSILITTFQASGNANLSARLLLSVPLCEAVLLWVVVPKWQDVGAAALFLSASLVTLLLLGIRYVRQLDAGHARRAARWFGTYAVALSVGAASGACIGLLVDGALWQALGGGCCYVGCVVGLGLITLPSHWQLRLRPVAPTLTKD